MKYLYNTPIAMPRGMHYGSDYWIAYSKKLHRKVHLYSMLEYANFLVLEMTPEIEYFCEQPLEISSTDTSKRTSVFDFWVYFGDGTYEFQEVKYSSELNGNDKASLRSQGQIALQRNWCEEHNCRYRVVTENELYKSEYYINNLDKLHSLVIRQQSSPNHAEEVVLYNFLLSGPCRIADIEKHKIFKDGTTLINLAQLHFQGIIAVDTVNRPLDRKTEIRLCENESTIFLS